MSDSTTELNHNALNYKAPPTITRFLQSRHPRKILAGPVGGGKTSGCIMHMLMNSIQQKPDYDGVRRTRHIVVRNTYQQLQLTTIKSILDWLPPQRYGQYLKSERTYKLTFNDVESEIVFLSLEDEEDVRKLLSLETTTFYFNEVREIPESVIMGALGSRRTGRYPSKKGGPGATYPCFIADTNMPTYGSFHYQIMERIIHDFEAHIQPGGRSPQAENLENLPSDYYDPTGLTEEHVRVFFDCEYGESKEGQPVFKQTFSKTAHVAATQLLPINSPNHPIIIGIDAGLTPAAIIGQQAPNGMVNILDEVFTPRGESIGMERFVTTRLLPLLRNRFPHATYYGIIDPAASQKAQANEATVLDTINRCGIPTRPATTNKLDIRIGSAEALLTRSILGSPTLQIDPRCTGLINALQFGYMFAKKRDGETEEKPLKDHPNSDIGDAFCYLATHFASPNQFAQTARRNVKTRSAAGWT